jgi:hypothetical protein
MDVIFVDIEHYDDLEEAISKTARKNYAAVLPTDKLQFPTIWAVEQLQIFLSRYCKSVYGSGEVRVWKGHSYLATNPLAVGIVEGLKDKSFEVQGRLLDPARYKEKDID